MGMKGTGKIYMYKCTWGPEVDITDPSLLRKAYRGCKNDLDRIFGVYIPRINYLYSPTLLMEPITLNSNLG